MKTSSFQHAFTLIELMVTLTVAAITLTIGVPSFRELIRNNRIATQANEFVSALHVTRNEAIKRGLRVTLCKSADLHSSTPACATTGNWEQGWIIFVDANNNTLADDGASSLIKVHEGLTGVTLTGNSTVDTYISYGPTGASWRANGQSFQAGTITLCSTSTPSTGRAITISLGGRALLSEVNCP